MKKTLKLKRKKLVRYLIGKGFENILALRAFIPIRLY